MKGRWDGMVGIARNGNESELKAFNEVLNQVDIVKGIPLIDPLSSQCKCNLARRIKEVQRSTASQQTTFFLPATV